MSLNPLFNQEGTVRRAIDICEGDTIDEEAFKEMFDDMRTTLHIAPLNAARTAQRAVPTWT